MTDPQPPATLTPDEETLEVAEFAEWYNHESPIIEETSNEH